MNVTTSEPPVQPGLRRHVAPALTGLAARLGELWRTPPADPFAFDLAVVPSAGVQRWLSQRLATMDGISAGVRFVRPAGLNRLVAGDRPDPWAATAAMWRIPAIVDSRQEDPVLAQLAAHLRGSRDPFAACFRIAGRFAAYAEWRPKLLAAWQQGLDVDASGNPLGDAAWQAHLWRLLRTEIGVDPLAPPSAAAVAELPERIAVFAPGSLSPRQLDLLTAIAVDHRVDLLLLDPAPGRPVTTLAGQRRRDWRPASRHPLNRSLGARTEQALALTAGPPTTNPATAPKPETLLGWLQADLLADRVGPTRVLDPADDSVQVHLSHGLDRQVEVLRDVLAGLLAADPSLEPRHVVVLTPDPDAVAPLVTAAFGLSPSGEPQHPGHQFRVQLADRTTAQANPLVGFLIDVLELGSTRAGASALLDLCAEPMVARRFGFTGERHDRLAELVQRAGVRWGLNSAHRLSFGLGLAQNTWFAGLQRLLLGVTLSEEDLVTAKTVLPVDDVDSSDVELVGGLAELISRLSRLVREFEEPTDIAGWAERCRSVLAQLVALEPAEQGWLAELSVGLRRIEREAGDATVRLPRAAEVALVRHHFENQPARSTFGNGSLVVAGLESLRSVPHRVVCLLGWDAERYPRRRARHGDDLLAADPWVGDPDSALADREALLAAVHAATEKLVVVMAGRSPGTNLEVPPAAPVAELLAALDATAATPDGVPAGGAVTVQHPLQPFDTSYFTGTGVLRSYDPVALVAAAAASAPPLPEPAPYRELELPPLAEDVVTVANLVAFFTHPVRQLVRVRTGLSWAESEQPVDELPIELDGLRSWSIGTRALGRALAGYGPDQVLQAEWRRGEVPPAELGRQAINRIVADVDAVLHRLPAAAKAPAVGHYLALDVDGTTITGQLETRDATLLTTEFSKLSARHKLAAWLRLLLLASAEPGEWRAVTVTKSRVAAWQAPEAEEARLLLGRLLAIYRRGMCHPLPLPPRVAEGFASLRANQVDPDDPKKGTRTLRQLWRFDSDPYWRAFFDYPDLIRLPRDIQDTWGPTDETTALGSLARAVWDPIRQHQVAP